MAEQTNHMNAEQQVNDLELGARLQKARRAKDMSIADVSKHLRLSKDIFLNLETEQWENFPSRAYTRGYISNYTKFLELPVDEMLEVFDKVCAKQQQQTNLSPYGPNKKPKQTPFWFWAVPTTIVLIAIVWGVFSLLQPDTSLNAQTGIKKIVTPSTVTSSSLPISHSQHSDMAKQVEDSNNSPATLSDANVKKSGSNVVSNQAENNAPAPVNNQQQDVDADSNTHSSSDKESAVVQKQEVSPSDNDEAPSSSDASSKFLAVIQFDGDCWIGITNRNGELVVSKEMQAGQVITLKNAWNYQLKLGKASNVRIKYEGKVIDLKPYTKNDIATLTLKD